MIQSRPRKMGAKQHAPGFNMKNKNAVKDITLRRNGKGPLKFKGERIGDASRTFKDELDDEGAALKTPETRELSVRLFRTAGGKYVLGYEEYNRTTEEYVNRDGFAADSLPELLEKIKESGLDDDILAEVFEDTEIADQFVEIID